MTAKRSRPDAKVEAASERRELAGSEINSQDRHTPWGILVASAKNHHFAWVAI